MTHRQLPSIQALDAPKGAEWDAPSSAYDRWSPVKAAHGDDKNTINMLDQIGETWDGSGMTAKIVNSVLRRAGGDDVTVNMNSPGGDFFEGVTIYNQLREYDGIVNVNVLGVAASAASIIAMAADELKIAKAGFMMIHNAWGIVIGSQHDMRDAADQFASFDDAMAGVYSDRSGNDVAAVSAMMAKDTWMGGEMAVSEGFADSLLNSDEVVEDTKKASSPISQIDIALAKAGMPRSERRRIFKEYTGTLNAADATRNAGEADPSIMAGLSSLLADVTGVSSNEDP